MRPSASSRVTSLGFMLLVSFALTITTFVTSTLLLRSRSQGVSEAAESIATDAAPSIQHLSDLRTALRRMEIALEATEREQAEEARRIVKIEWNRYLLLDPYPGEIDLRAKAALAMAAMTTSADRVLSSPDDRPKVALRDVSTDLRSAFDTLDSRLAQLADLKGQNAAQLGRQIVAVRRSVRSLSNLLYAFCAMFAAVAGLAAVGVVRRYARVMEFRVSELEHFAGRVAHDIRSPLATVGLALYLAEKSTLLEPSRRTAVTAATRTLQRVGQIVDGLLVFARAGAVPAPSNVSTEMQPVLQGVVEEMRPAATDKEIELTWEGTAPAHVGCSPGVLISLVANLVGNAIKYMGDAPVRRVVLRTRMTATVVRVEVADTGPGIPPDLLQKVFDPYVRAAQAAVPGLGLGLATVRRLAEAHGGSVGVESALGAGSTFWFELPSTQV